MENASKALLIAGGVLVSILVITLFIYMISKITEYQQSRVELANIENVSEFNKRFTNYQRNDVQGYELLSLIHNVIDYNQQYTTDSTIDKDTYNPVQLIVYFTTEEGNRDLRADLRFDETNRLFNRTMYCDDEFSALKRNTASSFQYKIENQIEEAKNSLNIQGDDVATKLAKNISSIFMTEEQVKQKASSEYGDETKTDAVYTRMANTFNQCTGNNLTGQDAKTKLVIDAGGRTNDYYNYANMLYEYMQFKRAQFKCTKLEYDPVTNRVSVIQFNIVRIR